MPIRVVVDSAEPNQPMERAVAIFDSPRVFVQHLHDQARVRQSLLGDFGIHPRARGSDIAVTMKDPNPGAGGFGGIELSYSEFYHMLQSTPVDERIMPNGAHIIAPFDAAVPAMFRFHTVDNHLIAGAGPLGVAAPLRQDNFLASDAGKIGAMKAWMLDPENFGVIDDCVKESKYVVEYPRQSMISDTRDLIAYYATLGCLLFGVEFYFGISVFHRIVRFGVGINHVPDRNTLDGQYAEFQFTRRVVSIFHDNPNENRFVSKMLRVVRLARRPHDAIRSDAVIPVLSDAPFSADDIAVVGKYLALDMVVYNRKGFSHAMSAYTFERQRRCNVVGTRAAGSFTRRMREAANRPMYTFLRGVANKHHSRSFNTMMFVATDLLAENKHIEPVFDMHMVHSFVRFTHHLLSPLVSYVDGEMTSIAMAERMKKSVKDLVQNGTYWEFVPPNLSKGLTTLEKKTIILPDLEGWINYLSDLQDLVTQYKRNLSSLDNLVAKAELYAKFASEIARVVKISSMVLRDDGSRGGFHVPAPWNDIGFQSMMDLFGHMCHLTESGLSFLEYQDARMKASKRIVRSIMLQRAIEREERADRNPETDPLVATPTRATTLDEFIVPDNDGVDIKMFNDVSSFSFVVNVEAYTLGDEVSEPIVIKFIKDFGDYDLLVDGIFNDTHKMLPQTGFIDAAVQELLNGSERLTPQMREYVLSKEGARLCMSGRNLLMDTLFMSKGASATRPSFFSIITPMMENLPRCIETLICYHPDAMEPILVTEYDHTRYGGEDTLYEVDCSKMFTSILQGGYQGIWERDIRGDPCVVGGTNNATVEDFDPDLAMTSYIMDFGLVFVDGPEIDWEMLQGLHPEYFSTVSTWHAQRGVRRLVDNYLVMHMCFTVCAHMGLRSTDERVDMCRYIQVDLLKIKWGMFDFVHSTRKALHKIPYGVDYVTVAGVGGRTTPAPIPPRCVGGYMSEHWTLRAIDDFGAVVSEAIRKRVTVGDTVVYNVDQRSDFNPRDGVEPYLRVNTTETNSEWAKAGQALRSCKAQSDRIFTRVVEAGMLLAFNVDIEDTDVHDQLKHQHNTFVGKLKYGANGGTVVISSTDIQENMYMIGAVEQQPQDDGQPPPAKRWKNPVGLPAVGVTDVHGYVSPWSPNQFYWAVPIPGERRQSLVGQSAVTIQGVRNSLAPWRRHVMNTCRAVMDDLACRGKAMRVATDSVLVKEEFRNVVVHRIQELTGTVHLMEGSRDRFPVVGHRMAYKVSLVNMEAGENALHSKYAALKLGTVATPKEPIEMDDHLTKMIANAREAWIVTKDSDLFWKFHTEELGRMQIEAFAPYANNGHELHAILMRDHDNPAVPQIKDCYVRFTEWSAKQLVEMGGAMLTGDPGAGKSVRVRTMCSLLKKDGHRPVVTSSMHSIVQLYRDEGDAEGSSEDDVADDLNPMKPPTCMTLAKFVGCRIDATFHARAPDKTLEFCKSLNKCLPRHYETLFVDEVETCEKAIEEFIKRVKENKRFGMRVFLVGDPLQSTAGRSRGFDMEGATARYVCNNNKYVFDMQFRNTSEEYANALELTASGLITGYRNPPMCKYWEGNRAIQQLSRLIDECAMDILTGRTEPVTFACASYKVGCAITTAVLRKMVEMGGGDVDNTFPPLIRGNRVLCSVAESESSCDHWSSIKRGKIVTAEQLKQSAARMGQILKRDPPSTGPRFMTGIPLVLREGMRFRVASRLDTMMDRKELEKSTVLVYLGRDPDAVLSYPLNKNKVRGVAEVYRFETLSKVVIRLTHIEVTMYLSYAFCVQKEFIIGATISRLIVVQPVLPNWRKFRNTAFRGNAERLREFENLYKESSVECSLARFLRVAATRKCSGDTHMIDLPVPRVRFWDKQLHTGGEYMVSNTKDTDQNEWKERMLEWKSVTLLGHRDMTLEEDEQTGGVEKFPVAVFPEERTELPTRVGMVMRHSTDGLNRMIACDQIVVDHDRLGWSRFPLYLRKD